MARKKLNLGVTAFSKEMKHPKQKKISKQKIGFDIHGVLDDLPATFVALNNAMYDAGHEIHVLTGASADDKIFAQLRKLGIKWHKFFSIVDYHLAIGTKVIYKKNGPWIDPELWNKTKGIYCKTNKIDLHFDDSMEYEPHFSTPFAKIFTKNNRNGRGKKRKVTAIKLKK